MRIKKILGLAAVVALFVSIAVAGPAYAAADTWDASSQVGPYEITAPETSGEITVPTTLVVPSGTEDIVVPHLLVADTPNPNTLAQMTSFPASGGGDGSVELGGATSGGGVGGGGDVCVYAIVDKNGVTNQNAITVNGNIEQIIPDPDGEDVPGTAGPLSELTGTDLQTFLDWIEALYNDGKITEDVRNDIIIGVQNAGNYLVFRGCLHMPYCNLAGDYEVAVKAQSNNQEGWQRSPFVFLDCVALDIDFQALVFPNNGGNTNSTIAGDYKFLMNSQLGQHPTIQNVGNRPLALSFGVYPMLKVGGTNLQDQRQRVDDYTVELQASSWANTEKWSETVTGIADTGVTLVVDDEQAYCKPLQLCNRAKLNVTATTQNIEQGTYTGKIIVKFEAAACDN